jgi:hypothetical protein
MENSAVKKDLNLPSKGERIFINQDLLNTLDRWIEQVLTNRKGVRLNRKEILHWLITHHAENLSNQEERDLVEYFYDDERYLREALKELKKIKAKDDKIRLQSVLPDHLLPESKKSKRKSKAGSTTSPTELTGETIS